MHCFYIQNPFLIFRPQKQKNNQNMIRIRNEMFVLFLHLACRQVMTKPNVNPNHATKRTNKRECVQMKTECARCVCLVFLAKKSRKWVPLLNFSEPDTKCNSWKLTFIERTTNKKKGEGERRVGEKWLAFWRNGKCVCVLCCGGGCLNIPRIKVKWLNANGIKLCRLTLDHILWSFSSFGWVNPFRFGWLGWQAGKQVGQTKCSSMQGKWSDLMCPIHENTSKQTIQQPCYTIQLIIPFVLSLLRSISSTTFGFARGIALSLRVSPSTTSICSLSLSLWQ